MLRTALKTPTHVDLSLILRGLFSSLVVWWHTIGAYQSEGFLFWLGVPGRVSVWVFFVLSGYVIAYGFLTQRYAFSFSGLNAYLLRRAARILPLFWLVLACAVVLSLYFGTGLPVTAKNLFASFFAFQWQHTRYFVGVFWTLGLELQFYLIAPLVFLPVVRSKKYGLYVLCALWVVLAYSSIGSGDDRSLLGNLQHFATGAIIAWLAINRRQWFERSGARGALLFGVLGILGLIYTTVHYKMGSFWSGSGALFTDLTGIFLLLSHVCLERLKVKAGAILSAAMIIGILAYGIYAWHGLILTFFTALTNQFLAVYGLSVMAALASFLLMERPAIDAARRFERRHLAE